jgi:site-specific recombinase XerD
MPNVNFYLKAPKSKEPTLIILQMKYKGQRLVFSTGESILPAQWNAKKQMVKNISATTGDGKFLLNDHLKSLARVLQGAYLKELQSGIPAPETLKKYLRDYMSPPVVKKATLLSFIEAYMKTADKKPNTVKKYGTLLTHLRDYNPKLDFGDIDLNFFHLYVDFLQKKWKLARNTIAKDIAVLKALMNEAQDRKLHNNTEHRHRKFSYAYEDVESVYLTDEEIRKLYKHDFSANKRLEAVRDTFVVGCLTGLRFGDYSSLKPENIRGNFIEVFSTEKTGESVTVPVHEYVAEIYKKYQGFPRKMSVQKFNVFLKEVCRLAGMDQPAGDRFQTAPATELYKLVSSHTARRSFCTNHYLSGFPAIDLMKISGHRTEKAFLKYVKLSHQKVAERLASHMAMKKLKAV